MADDDKAAPETDRVEAEHDGGARQHAEGVVSEGAVFGVGIEDQRSQQKEEQQKEPVRGQGRRAMRVGQSLERSFRHRLCRFCRRYYTCFLRNQNTHLFNKSRCCPPAELAVLSAPLEVGSFTMHLTAMFFTSPWDAR